jgi:hypothetical protein
MGARREVLTPRCTPGAAPVASAPPGSVRVTGAIRRRGLALEGYDVSFASLVPGHASTECDWDFADEEGRYEVELRPGLYVVRNESGAEVTAALVPAGVDALALDLDL